jgi:hypothetical protein
MLVSLVLSSSCAAFSFSSASLRPAPFSKTAIIMMSDTQKRMGRTLIPKILFPETPALPEIEVPFFHPVPPGSSGMDERSPTNVSEEFLSLQSKQLSNISKSLKQKSLKMVLESDAHGTVSKLQQISYAASLQCILPESMISGGSRIASLSAGGLFDDWDSSIDL